jgi:hypothetical protein
MGDGDALHEQILRVETHLEKLTDAVEKCRKIDLISKVADIVGGGLLILATTLGVVGFNPAVTMGSIAAVIAGTVWIKREYSKANCRRSESRRDAPSRVDQQTGFSRGG